MLMQTRFLKPRLKNYAMGVWCMMAGWCAPALVQTQSLKSVAVIRFDNRSPLPENNWLGIGFAETLTSKLGMVDGLMVMERTKLHEILTAAGKTEPIDENRTEVGLAYAKMIGVEYLLIGSVQVTGSYKNPASQLRINARMIKTSTADISGNLTFSANGNIKDIFAIQTELAEKFCTALGVTSGLAGLTFEDAQSIEAQQWYGRGLKAYYEANYAAAIELFRSAVNNNEGVFYAAAHTMEGYARQKQIERAQDAEKQTYKQAYLDQFRRDAGEAAPAFYDLGIAHQATGLYDDAVKSFGEYLRYMDKASQLVTECAPEVENPRRIQTVEPDSNEPYDIFRPAVQKGFYYRLSKGSNYETNGVECVWNNGAVRWRSKLPDCGGESPQLNKMDLFGDTLYMGAYVIAMVNNKTGKAYWQFPERPFLNDIGWPLLIEDVAFYKDKMYISANNTIYIINRSTGKKLAEYRGGSGVYVKEGIFNIGANCVNVDRLLEQKLYTEVDALHQISKTYLLAQRLDSALKYAEAVMQSYPNHIGANEITAHVALAQGQRKTAVDRIIQLYTLTPNHTLRDIARSEFGILGVTTFHGWLATLKYDRDALWAVFGGEFNRGANVNELWRIDAVTDQTVWRKAMDYEGQYTLSYDADSSYIYCAWPRKAWENNAETWKYDLLCLSKKNGQVVWKTLLRDQCQVTEGVYSSSIVPRIDGDFLYITFYNGNVYKVSRSNGAIVWGRSCFGDGTIRRYEANEEYFTRCNLGIVSQVVYVHVPMPSAQRDTVIGFDKITGQRRLVLPETREFRAAMPEDTTATALFSGYGSYGYYPESVFTEKKIYAGSKDQGILILDRAILEKLRADKKIWWH
ncbi:MAG TPA: PQQ-binding-like beta-propeller repeat protein [bacterium]|nr:PQQ-binding-like beta-propeller repeat protein [bacterium]